MRLHTNSLTREDYAGRIQDIDVSSNDLKNEIEHIKTQSEDTIDKV
ncbi:hypothetical protein [Subsaximicrobium wynnwilliamsii]|nr:hypothetical protein [Subsaximicrobium wynnwilliamsii]